MKEKFIYPPVLEEEAEWKKNRRLVREGFEDLEYLPRSRSGWNATLAALAYSAQRQFGPADLNLWAAMHGCPASGRYGVLGANALVLWHGTSARRAMRIREVGLFHKRGLWTTLEPKIAHGYTRSRSQMYGAGSAMVVLLLDRRELTPGADYTGEGTQIFRFHSGLSPEHIEYILWSDRIEFVGEHRAEEPKPWGVARFKKKGGQWAPLSQPPVRFDSEHEYRDKEEWLHLGIRRIVTARGSAPAAAIFSSLYATIDPWDALTHEEVFRAVEKWCTMSRPRGRARQFWIENEEE